MGCATGLEFGHDLGVRIGCLKWRELSAGGPSGVWSVEQMWDSSVYAREGVPGQSLSTKLPEDLRAVSVLRFRDGEGVVKLRIGVRGACEGGCLTSELPLLSRRGLANVLDILVN